MMRNQKIKKRKVKEQASQFVDTIYAYINAEKKYFEGVEELEEEEYMNQEFAQKL